MIIGNSMDGCMAWVYRYQKQFRSVYPQACGWRDIVFNHDLYYHWARHSSKPLHHFLAKLEALYPCSRGNHTGTPVSEAAWQFMLADRDYNIHCAANYLAEQLQRRGVPVWRGTFGVGARQYDEGCISGMVPCCQNGVDCYGVATHGAEIPFVFNTTMNACRSESVCSEFVVPFSGHEAALVRSIQQYWTTFLATGSPVDLSGARPVWPQANKGIANLRVPQVTIDPASFTRECKFWSAYYPGQHWAPKLVV